MQLESARAANRAQRHLSKQEVPGSAPWAVHKASRQAARLCRPSLGESTASVASLTRQLLAIATFHCFAAWPIESTNLSHPGKG